MASGDKHIIATKEFVNTGLSGKIDKDSSSSGTTLFGRDSGGIYWTDGLPDGAICDLSLTSDLSDTGSGSYTWTNNGITFANDATLGRNVAVFNGSSYAMADDEILGTGDLTVSFWVKNNTATSASGEYVAFGNSDRIFSGANRGVCFSIVSSNYSGHMVLYNIWDSASIMRVDTGVSAGTDWIHICIRMSGNTKIYVNNVPYVLSDSSLWRVDCPNKLCIGGPYPLGACKKMNGRMANFRVYHRGLTDLEIASLYNEFTIA